MARCEGTTKSGNRCKLDARPGSRFCHLHDALDENAGGQDAAAQEDAAELGDLVPLIVAGAMAAGLLFFMRAFGRWLPRM